jgi:hypothetical protein
MTGSWQLVMRGGSVDPLSSPLIPVVASSRANFLPASLTATHSLSPFSFSRLVYEVMNMDGLLSGEVVNDREEGHNEVDDSESASQLSVDTPVVNHADHHQNGTPLTCANNDEDDSLGSVQITGIHKTPPNSSNYDAHSRVRAMSESERTLFSSETGVRIFQKDPSHFYTQLTPPHSSSLASFDTHNPYSTSAHIIPPLRSVLDSPQSNFGFVYPSKRPTVTPRSSLALSYHNSEDSSLCCPTEGGSRSLSLSYDNSTQHTYVDASSYDSIPDSPATRVQISG